MNKKIFMIGVAVISVTFVFFLILGIIFATGYNNLVDKDVNVENSYSQVENRLLQRHDQISQLVDVVEGYSAHEQAIYDAITSVREAYSGSDPITDDTLETAAFNNLLVVVEDNMEIQADTLFLSLMESVEQMESALSQARKDYNDSVALYNSAVRKFPINMFANMFGFISSHDYWSVDGSATDVPTITFN
jgi:LemA protein